MTTKDLQRMIYIYNNHTEEKGWEVVIKIDGTYYRTISQNYYACMRAKDTERKGTYMGYTLKTALEELLRECKEANNLK